MTQYGMAIDLRRCIGCQACAAACKVANNLPTTLAYNVVSTVGGASYDTPSGSYPNCEMSFMPMQCQHCAMPSCVAVCPTGASAKDENGIVTIDYEVCIGCGSCIEACPYNVRQIIEDDPEYYLEIAMGEEDAPPHLVATVEKCTFCKNLISRDEVPACMQLCPGRARYWGDLDDPESAPNKAAEGREVMRYLEQEQTVPSVLYLQ